MDELNHLGWVVSRSYELADVQFGVRTNSAACGRWLDATFAAFQIDDETAPYYSLLVAETDGDTVGKRFHVVYEESRALVKTLDVRLAGEALIAQFEHVAARGRDDAVFVEGGLVTFGDVVAVVPPILPPYLMTLGQRTIERSGLHLPLANYVALDPKTGVIVQPESELQLAPHALDGLAPISASPNGKRPASPSAPLRADVVCFIGLDDEPVRPYSPGSAAHLLATRVLNFEQIGGGGLEAVAKLASAAQSYEIRAVTPKQTLETLVGLLRSVPP